MVTLRATLFLIVMGASSLASAQPRSEKRGLGYGYHSPKDMEVLASGVSWWYNWHFLPDEKVRDTHKQSNVAYVPMAWNGDFDAEGMINYLESNPDVEYLLGFNEPNFIDQANMTPTAAAARWPELEAIADQYDLKLVGPAVNYCGNCVSEGGVTYTDPIQYLDDFFEACVDCRVDHIAIHWYGCGGLEWYIDLFKKYGKPIWVTEIACWDQDNITLDQQKSYLVNVVDLMENDPFVYKYAWFIGRGGGPHISLLGDDGELTELGELYVNMPIHDTTHYEPLPTRIEAENYQRMWGIQLELTADQSGLINVGYIDDGDSIVYQVEVTRAGNYTFDWRYAGTARGAVNLLVNGVQDHVVELAPTGGWQNWKTLEDSLFLDSGKHQITLAVTRGGFNLNWIDMLQSRVSPLGLSTRPEVGIFPNPTTGPLSIYVGDLGNGSPGILTIRDMSGRALIYRTDMNTAGLHHLDLYGLPSGLYILELEMGGEMHHFRVILK